MRTFHNFPYFPFFFFLSFSFFLFFLSFFLSSSNSSSRTLPVHVAQRPPLLPAPPSLTTSLHLVTVGLPLPCKSSRPTSPCTTAACCLHGHCSLSPPQFHLFFLYLLPFAPKPIYSCLKLGPRVYIIYIILCLPSKYNLLPCVCNMCAHKFSSLGSCPLLPIYYIYIIYYINMKIIH